MSLNQFLLAVGSNRETCLVCLRRWLLEIVLMQRLVVSCRVLWHISAAFMSDFKVISLKMFNEFSRWLDRSGIRRMNKLFLLRCRLLEFVISAANAEV